MKYSDKKNSQCVLPFKDVIPFFVYAVTHVNKDFRLLDIFQKATEI